MKDIKNIFDLITDNSDSESKKETIQFLKNDEEANNIFFKMKYVWALTASQRNMSNHKIEKSYRELYLRMHKPKPVFKFHQYLKYAAVFFVAVVISQLVFISLEVKKSPGKEQYTSVVADEGQISKVILPDSTIVWLNSGTSLIYNSNFSVDNRSLELRGQAYLNVKRNIDLPLIVDCGELLVEVLGTRFDVSSYPDENEIVVVLESGKVELKHSDEEKVLYQMKPGERAVFNLEQKKVKIDALEVAGYTSWKDGVLIFYDAKLNEVTSKLRRKFGVEFEIRNEKLLEVELNAKFKNESLEEIVRYIEFACHAQTDIIRDNGIITRIILK